jgi:hypothetical protein
LRYRMNAMHDPGDVIPIEIAFNDICTLKE